MIIPPNLLFGGPVMIPRDATQAAFIITLILEKLAFVIVALIDIAFFDLRLIGWCSDNWMFLYDSVLWMMVALIVPILIPPTIVAFIVHLRHRK